jgi:hypothetical protein
MIPSDQRLLEGFPRPSELKGYMLGDDVQRDAVEKLK